MIGVVRDVLFIDTGTAPGPRGLTIYDLRRRSVALKSSWAGNPKVLHSGELELWIPEGPADPEECPQFEYCEKEMGGSYAMTKHRLNLQTFELTQLDEVSCDCYQ